MKVKTKDGLCMLCGQWRALRHSHVYPALGYKRYVSNLDRGGAFVDLAELRRHNRQLKYYWFCYDCEGRFGETETAAWLDALPHVIAPQKPYCSHIFAYAVSIVLRCALREQQDSKVSQAYKAHLAAPIKSWRERLLGKRKGLGIYTVHGFIAKQDENDAPWPMALGGQVAYPHDLVVTRTGPLVIVGVLNKRNLSVIEAKQWSATEILPMGGTLESVSKSDNFFGITPRLAEALNATETWCIKQAARMK